MAEDDRLYTAILQGDADAAVAITAAAIESGSDPAELVSGHMIPAMDEVGRRFECHEFFVPELLFAGRAMKAALTLLRPLLAAGSAEPAGRVVIGTVQGDLHDIGKNLVAALLEGGGFQIHDLGVDASAAKFVDAVKRHSPHIVALSALLTVTLPAMKATIEALRRAGVRDSVKVMVGGAPVTRQYAGEIGADGYSDNAFGAVRLARSLMEKVPDGHPLACNL
ncbi:MAG TPA: corrinoid protein [Candidatus Sulfopaludibacter sp.]|nr:corrinoid protein [Candidatus Sulfopaludibacter sp.]